MKDLLQGGRLLHKVPKVVERNRVGGIRTFEEGIGKVALRFVEAHNLFFDGVGRNQAIYTSENSFQYSSKFIDISMLAFYFLDFGCSNRSKTSAGSRDTGGVRRFRCGE